MFQLLVIMTGGTIGSEESADIIDTSEKAADGLIHRYEQRYGRDVAFDVLHPLNILSENSTPSHWETLCSAIARLDLANYRGIVVTHGSDTLSYGSALLGLLFGRAPLPIVITASSYPLEDPRSNGLRNFKNAVDFIRSTSCKGVYTVYENSRGESMVYLSTRLLEADPRIGDFGSFGGPALGMMLQGRFQWNPAPENPSLPELCQSRPPVLRQPVAFRRSILFLRPYPGLDYRTVSLEPEPAAVLHYLYHSATACTQPGPCSLPAFLKRCGDKGIPAYIASFQHRNSYYSTSKQLLQAGARPLYDISPEAAYVKLLIAYNQTELPVEEFLSQPLFYESLPCPEHMA